MWLDCCIWTFPAADYHSWLLSDEVDLLPTLLLPLAGPEEVGDEVMEKLPEELQYLPDDKQREVEPDIRKMLLEALMQVGGESLQRGNHNANDIV